MPSAVHLPVASRRRGAAACAVLTPDLERFWPSRRGHAFDELCRR